MTIEKKYLIDSFRHKSFFAVLTTIFFVVTIFAGCAYHYKTKEITSHSLAGVWLPSSDSRLPGNFDVKDNLLKNTELRLFEDKSFELKNMPNCWETADIKCISAWDFYKGNWSILKDKNNNSLLFITIDNSSETRTIEIESDNNSIYLYFFIGDPDSNQRIVFKK